MAKIEESNIVVGVELEDVGGIVPEFLGFQPNLWAGPKWNVLGFLVQYLLAFGIVFVFGETRWGRGGEGEKIRVGGMVEKRERDGKAVIEGWKMAAPLSL
ncbi:hypothetical protein ES319_D08G079300v1 [Gossypium barbadense]|uniref:Uncharacterized protein n=2 Tax=Gossypium TaxID=3633 RepID=A0A5J5QAV0_GOSBA|nr:hypothetical protein ES319_D08G079300v1 [Gossypium barbadense]TYG56698.1 hypothetical protein ES288_D08G084100v1 [Gossypium darwinii]